MTCVLTSAHSLCQQCPVLSAPEDAAWGCELSARVASAVQHTAPLAGCVASLRPNPNIVSHVPDPARHSRT